MKNDKNLILALKASNVPFEKEIKFNIDKANEIFFDFSIKNLTYPRLFEHFKNQDFQVYFSNLMYEKLDLLDYKKEVYVYTEDQEVVVKLLFKDLIKVINEELPNMTIYITNKDLKFMIAFTEENNMLMAGNIL